MYPLRTTILVEIEERGQCRRLNVCWWMTIRYSGQGVQCVRESENDCEVVGESPDGGDAVEKARRLRSTSP